MVSLFDEAPDIPDISNELNTYVSLNDSGLAISTSLSVIITDEEGNINDIDNNNGVDSSGQDEENKMLPKAASGKEKMKKF